MFRLTLSHERRSRVVRGVYETPSHRPICLKQLIRIPSVDVNKGKDNRVAVHKMKDVEVRAETLTNLRLNCDYRKGGE